MALQNEPTTAELEAAMRAGNLLGFLLGEQQQMTAVESFARAHEENTQSRQKEPGQPAQAKYYRALLPANEPGPGQQYAFDVDLDRCSGCKSCVAACHSLNGLDEYETWRDVGLLIGGTRSAPVMQHVTTACHHCLEPACMIACPVEAYSKDPLTGIVKHLDDQCFGCQYCTLACPYDVPKYHKELGIVRKCDMCSSRLQAGEAPACVQACPHEAIRIQIIDVAQVKEDAEAAVFLPAAPDPQITLPTTTYRTRRVFPRNLLPADYYNVHPQHPHWPLIVMLVLTQLSVGAFLVSLLLKLSISANMWTKLQPIHAGGALFFGLVALAASVLHLGRPQYAFRGILGLKHSWLSREILAFGVFAGLAVVYFLAVHAQARGILNVGVLLGPLSIAVAVAGVAGVFCSVMIYAFTKREFWSFLRTSTRFGLTTALLGVAAIWLSLLVIAMGDSSNDGALLTQIGDVCAKSLLLIAALKLTWEASLFWQLANPRMTALRRSALLMQRQLLSVTIARFALGLLGGIVMPGMLLMRAQDPVQASPVSFIVIVGVLVLATVVGELLERYLFFAAVASPRMPGAIQ